MSRTHRGMYHDVCHEDSCQRMYQEDDTTCSYNATLPDGLGRNGEAPELEGVEWSEANTIVVAMKIMF